MTQIGINGKIKHASGDDECDICELKCIPGSKMVTIAMQKDWGIICKACLQSSYINVYGNN